MHPNSLPPQWSDRILCYYENLTSQIQLARIGNIPHRVNERLVFPGQRLLFESLPDAFLEVHTCTTEMKLLERIPCLRLQVNQSRLAAPPLPDYAAIDITE